MKAHLRIGGPTFCRIIDVLPGKHHGWPQKFELVVFLYWLATGTSYRVVGCAFNLSRFTVKQIVHKKLDDFTTIAGTAIKYPCQQDYEAIGQGFCQRAGSLAFERVLGAIDGTHISIKCPVPLHDQYINRKLRYSIQLQAVCDHKGKFLSIFTGCAGSVHDQRVLRNSPLYCDATFPPHGYFLLGDSGYQCSTQPVAIITPYKQLGTLDGRQRRFNLYHSKARSIVECSFGYLKARWRCIFNKDLELKIPNCIKTIVACCVMHNLCLQEDALEESYEHSNEENTERRNQSSVEVDTEDGISLRNQLASNL